MTQTINAYDALSCPVATITLSSQAIAETELAQAAWSDGYLAKFEVTLGANTTPTAAGWTGVCFGIELTTSSAVNGAYCIEW